MSKVRIAVFFGRTDHNGIATDGNTVTKFVTSTGITGFQQCLLGPDATAAGEDISRTGIDSTVITFPDSWVAIFPFGTNYDGVVTDGNATAKLVISVGITCLE